MELKFIDEEQTWLNSNLIDYIRLGNVPNDWRDFFIENEDELDNISKKIVAENCKVIYPPLSKVFRAFIPKDKIKVVILGQDPYHNGSAIGLCFSVLPGNDINPSLRNIYSELKNEGYFPKENGNLTHWSSQGCMLLNTALTVEKGCPESHVGIWYDFMERVIIEIAKNKNVVWLLMGAKALSFEKYINIKQNIFITSHPSPLSATRGFKNYPAFIGSNVFRKINDFLINKNIKPIEW